MSGGGAEGIGDRDDGPAARRAENGGAGRPIPPASRAAALVDAAADRDDGRDDGRAAGVDLRSSCEPEASQLSPRRGRRGARSIAKETSSGSSNGASSETRLEWPGRTFRAPAAERDTGGATRLIGLRCVEAAARGAVGDPVRLVHGDALDVARALAAEGLAGKVDLVYLDPPYASEADYVLEARLDGPADGRVRRSVAYEDKWKRGGDGVGAYLDVLAPRLEALARLLSPRGTIWVHLDWRAAYLVRVLLDEILGRAAFKNEIVWRRAPNLGRQATSAQFGRTLDTIVVYGRERAVLVPPTRLEPIEASAIRWEPEELGGRPFTTAPRGDYTDASIAKLDKEGRVHRTASGRAYIKYFLVQDEGGRWCRERRVDALWTDVPPLRHAATTERTGFPTQKPRALLDRIVACATEPGAIVVDLFSGSGTTADAARALGRRAIAGDAGAAAIATTRARLLRGGAPVIVERCGAPVVPAPIACDVATTREADGRVRVTLRAPKEPLAWAIDAEPHPGAPFRATWRAERAPGARPVPAPSEAIVEARGDLVVRAWGDDGAVGERIVRASEIGAGA